MSRFFHIRCVLNEKGGATVQVQPALSPLHVDIRSVECSSKDNYDKKKGRSLCLDKPFKTIPLRQLPDELKAISLAAKRHGRIAIAKTNYDYAVKYFLPKD